MNQQVDFALADFDAVHKVAADFPCRVFFRRDCHFLFWFGLVYSLIGLDACHFDFGVDGNSLRGSAYKRRNHDFFNFFFGGDTDLNFSFSLDINSIREMYAQRVLSFDLNGAEFYAVIGAEADFLSFAVARNIDMHFVKAACVMLCAYQFKSGGFYGSGDDFEKDTVATAFYYVSFADFKISSCDCHFSFLLKMSLWFNLGCGLGGSSSSRLPRFGSPKTFAFRVSFLSL